MHTAKHTSGQKHDVVLLPLVPWISLPGVLLFLIVGFGDGLGYYLRNEFGLPSPHLLMLPILGLSLFLAYEASPELSLRQALESIFIPIAICVGWMILQLSISGQIYFLGFGQLVLFLILVSLVRRLFEAVPRRITEGFLGAVFVIHYVQCSYIILAAVFWNILDVNINLLNFLGPLESSEVYGIRYAGLSREPAWAAYSIASSYLAIHYFRPASQFRALIAFVIAAILINSGTGYFLVISFAAAYWFKRYPAGSWVKSSFIGLGALFLLTYLQWDRLVSVVSGLDSSLLMRRASMRVAFQVIADSFPLGTGYGNFRSYGVYGAEFDTYINLAQAAYYKSDVLSLNLVAELGLLGFAFLAWIVRIFWVRGFVFPMLMGLTLLILFGTALVPAVVAIAAITGLLASSRVHQEGEQSIRASSPGRIRLIGQLHGA